MKYEVELEGMDEALLSERRRVADVEREAITAGAEGLKAELRSITRPVLGAKIAFTWQARIYDDGRTGFVYSKAPGVIAANMRSSTIVPVNGTPFLSIPTENVPKFGRFRRRMTPEMVEAYYNQDMIVLPGKRPQTLMGFIESTRGRRQTSARSRRGRGRRSSGGRKAPLIHMFTFVRNVKTRKVVDPDSAFKRWSQWTKRKMERELG